MESVLSSLGHWTAVCIEVTDNEIEERGPGSPHSATVRDSPMSDQVRNDLPKAPRARAALFRHLKVLG